MKQSTKLLSLVLAIVMAFSCMSVIGSAADSISTYESVTYDSIDDALLTPEQVADIALDLVDGLLLDADLGVIEIDAGITKILIVDLTNVNTTLDSLYDLATGALFGIAAGLVDAGDIENLNFDELEWQSTGSAVQRGNGNLQVVYHLLAFLADNTHVLKKAVYGIESGDSRGITLGLVGSVVDLDLGEINDILTNLSGFVGDLIYDLLLFGSYRHPLDAEELKAAGQSLPYGGSIDHMLENAVLNLVVDPQDYKYNDADEKVWDMNSIVIPSLKAALGENEANRTQVLADLDLNAKSVFDVLNYVAQYAIDDLGVVALNNNLKKGLMEAVEVEFNEIDKNQVPADVLAVFDNEAAYTTYIGYDCLQKDAATGEWYYTTKETQDVLGPNGAPLKDEDGNVVTERVRVYFKANTATANDFFNLINWDYKILKSTDAGANSDASAGAINCVDYNYFVTGENGYGSIVESLNHIIYIVYENALTEEVKADFEATTGAGWVDGATSATLEGSTEKIFNYNINRLVKYLLANFADKMFGSDSAYADKETYTYDGFWADKTIIDIAALIGPSFFTDVMPQLVMPVDENGAYAFADSVDGSSVALLQFGAIVLREFMSEIAPAVNYDDVIFAAGTLTSADGRQFADHTADEWFNIILNMGVDIGYTYLGNITNFGDKFTFTTDGTALATKEWRTTTLPEAHTAETAVSEARWQGMLDEAIIWAVGYVGQGSNGVITGINPDAVAAIEGPFNKLSYVLNTLLPLGFVNGCESANYDLDVEVVFNKLKTLLTTFDLTVLTSLFGRNGIDGSTLKRGNILAQPVIPMVLNLVNDILYLVFGANIFPATDTLDNVLVQENLSTVIETLITRLNAVKEPLLLSALPVVGKLIKGWGTEQSFAKPSIGYPTVIQLNNAGSLVDGSGNAITETITVKNGANGIWRSWIDANGTRQYDNQYQIEVTGVNFIDFETNQPLSGMSYSNLTTGLINYGKEATFDVSVSGLTSSKVVRMDISYKVYEGTTEMVAGATYTESVYTYLSIVPTDAGKENQHSDTTGARFGTYSPQYFDISQTPEDLKSDIENRAVLYFRRHKDDYPTVGGEDKVKGGTTITITADTDDAVTPGSGTIADELGKGTTRNWDPMYIFKDGSYASSNDDKSLVVSGASIDTTKLAAKTHGSTSNFTFKKTITLDSCNASAVNKEVSATFVYYDGALRSQLDSAVSAEIRRGRVEGDYLTTGYSYADRVLNTATYTDEITGEEVLKETNFTATAWVDSEGEPLASGITVTPNADDEEIGTYEVDGQKYTAKLVTKIDNSTVWATYVAAVKAAAAASLDGLTVDGVKNADYAAILDALNAAATDISYCAADVAADPTVSDAITDLKSTLDTVEASTTDKYDYTDYMMWRLNRLNDAREDASYYINLKKDADRVYNNVDKKFPYTSIEKDDLQALVALADNAEALNGNGNLVLALLEDLTADEAKAKQAWLESRDEEYTGVTAFDIALAKSLLQKTSTRLRDREYKVDGKADTTVLATEIASAEAMFTDSSLYTERSWTKYAAALADAKAVVNGNSQMDAFDAKWELLCCRNELVLVEDEADYSELEALIAQAEYALSHQDKYNNTAKELGQVLAELGIEGDVVTADGYGINLFPGSAVYTNAEPYTVDDQDIIDDAADELKEALARLKFYNVEVGAVEGNGNVDYSGETTIVFDNPETTDVDESVVVKLATIGAGMNEDAVKALFNVTATGATVGADNVTVSNDRHYSIDKYEVDEDGNKVLVPFQGFAGTNSVVTFYTVQDGIKIPVATIKLVVNGDINGDGTVDVIDAAQMHLAANSMATLEGCYFVAGNLAGAADDTRVIDGDDYTQIINAVIA